MFPCPLTNFRIKDLIFEWIFQCAALKESEGQTLNSVLLTVAYHTVCKKHATYTPFYAKDAVF